jgi:branched-chain amino acid transport system substrate-binding protein
MRRLRLLSLVLLLEAGCSVEAPVANPVDIVSIASDFPLTGVFSTAPLKEAVAFATAQAGPIGRYHLAFRSFDDSLAGVPEPAKGAQNVKRMLQDPSVLAMVGPANSPAAVEEIPVASAGELAMVSPTNTFNCLTLRLPGCQLPRRPGGMNNYFRIAAPDVRQGTAMADFALTSLHLNRVSVLGETGPTDYGPSLANSFSREFTTQGGTVTLNEQYLPTTNDFSDVLNRIAAGKAQAIYVAGVPSFGACRIRAQMRGILPEGTYFLGADALVGQTCITDAGGAANEQMVATEAVSQPNLKDPRAKNYLKSHSNPDADVFAAYDCVLILVDAIRRGFEANHGRVPSREQVLAAVSTTAGLKGITGTWSFDANGDATAPGMSFYQVQGGRWVLWKSNTLGMAPS